MSHLIRDDDGFLSMAGSLGEHEIVVVVFVSAGVISILSGFICLFWY